MRVTKEVKLAKLLEKISALSKEAMFLADAISSGVDEAKPLKKSKSKKKVSK